MRKTTERLDAGAAEDEDPPDDEAADEGAGSAAETDVRSPAWVSSPLASAAAKMSPSGPNDTARSSLRPESSTTNGLAPSLSSRYRRPGDSVPANMRPAPSIARHTTCAAGGRYTAWPAPLASTR